MPYYQLDDIVLKDYKIEAFIGEGGFGEVYRALDIHLQQSYAIKIIRRSPGMDDAYFEKARQRFMLEARLGARLNHPNLIRAVRFAPDETSGLLVLVMEYAPGGSLADKMKSGPLAVPDALRIACQVAAGLSALHAQDVVHRDLKPSNILFDANGVARVADLGLAQPASAVHVGGSSSGGGGEFHASPGTPAYMSPEQESGKPHLPPASDIYALGLILFEMLTGRSYKNQPQGTRLSKLRSNIPAALDDLLVQMLSDDPHQRPWDGAAAEKMLAACQGDVVNVDATVVSVALPQSPKWTLEDGLSAIKDMETEQEWQMALDVLEQLEVIYPDHPKLKLPRKKITQALKIAQEAATKAKREAILLPGYIRRSGGHIFLRLDKKQEIEFIRIPAGKFLMGSDPHKDRDSKKCEQPQHAVYLDEYWIGRYTVTNIMFCSFLQEQPQVPSPDWWQEKDRKFLVNHDRFPAVGISWKLAIAFCDWLSQITNKHVVLPTEAQWEKASRGVDGRIYPWGNTPPNVTYCNYDSQVNTATEVGKYTPKGDSPYGLADVAGNIWEWCADWYDEDYYRNTPYENPVGPESGQFRVMRGGAWNLGAKFLRCAYRYWALPYKNWEDMGFRIAIIS